MYACGVGRDLILKGSLCEKGVLRNCKEENIIKTKTLTVVL